MNRLKPQKAIKNLVTSCVGCGTQYSTSLNEFKRKLSENVNNPPPPKYHYCGNRVAQIHHSRLSLECRALKQHLHKKKNVDSPLYVLVASLKLLSIFSVTAQTTNEYVLEPFQNIFTNRLNLCSLVTLGCQRMKTR